MNIAFPSVVDLDPPLAGAMLAFDNSFARLPATFYTRLALTAMPDPYLVAASPAAAALVGLGPQDLGREPWLAALAGNRVLPGSDPLAAVYAGHQFVVHLRVSPDIKSGAHHIREKHAEKRRH